MWEQKNLGVVQSFSGPRTEKFSFLGIPISLENFNGKLLARKLTKKQKTGLSNTTWSEWWDGFGVVIEIGFASKEALLQ